MGVKEIICTIFLTLSLCSCGSSSPFDSSVPLQVSPIISRISPNTGAAGDSITIFGFGFSAVPGINIIDMGTVSTTATAYNLVANPTTSEIESLTFTIPDSVVQGTHNIVVMVGENVSNSDQTLTVN